MILIQWKFYLKIKRIHGVYFRAFSNRKNFKRFICEKQSENPIAPKIHNLILLSQKANLEVPKEIREKIQIINTFNISARYDDYKKSFANKCTNEYTAEQVKNIEEVQKWLKEQ